MLDTMCPTSVSSGNDCDSIISIKLAVQSGSSPAPPAPNPPPPTAGGVHVGTGGPPRLVHANERNVSALGMAHFAQTLYIFPGGQLFTNFQTTCDVCVPHRIWEGRSFSSVDNGTTWTEILPIANGAHVWKTCIPGDDPSWNSLSCYAYPLAIADPSNNRTGNLLMSRFEVDSTEGVRQVSVVNSTIDWPAPGLIPFADSIAPGNWFMVADGVPLATNAKGIWLMALYGELPEPLLPANTTHQNLNESSAVLVLVKNTDASLTSWEYFSSVNTGQPWECAASRGTYWPLSPHNLCNPTESAMVRLADGKILVIWRNDPGYNVTLMAQTSDNDGQTWTLAAPMHGKITDGDFEDVVDAPFGVEPKLQMMGSGVLVLSTGRPRMYVWALAAGADPLTATWQSYDLGKLHNAAIAAAGNGTLVPPFPADFWEIWRGASDPSLRGTGCCTDAYTGLAPISSTELVITYDMLARSCQADTHG